MSPNTPDDGDLTGPVPKINRSAVEGDTVRGLNVAGQEFKLSDVLKEQAPAFSQLAFKGVPSDHPFRHFKVREMPGNTMIKATFGLMSNEVQMTEHLISKAKELFGVEVEDMSDVVSEFPYIIQVNDENVLSYALEIFKTLDAQLGEIKKGL